MPLHFNLHNHTTWSDGSVSPRDLASAAASCGLTHLGISDHFRSTKLKPENALELAQVPVYVEELRSLRAQYQDRLIILAGMEINFSLLQTDFTFLSGVEPDRNPLNALDYLLFEYVNESESFGLGLEELLRLRPLIQVPMGLAHNDLEKNFAGAVHPESLARILAQSQIFVELCPTRRNSRTDQAGEHVPYYRAAGEFNRRFFAACRKEGVLLSVGCDVHADLRDLGETADAASFLAELELEPNAVIHHYWRSRG